jgi:hypothetical protein
MRVECMKMRNGSVAFVGSRSPSANLLSNLGGDEIAWDLNCA